MPLDPRQLAPTQLCRLLNSTPLGDVITERQLSRHRTRAGLRLGEGNRVDLLRYVAWLAQVRHAPKTRTKDAHDANCAATVAAELAEAAQGAAALACVQLETKGHGQKATRRQEMLIAALLTEPTYAAAAAKAGVSEATVYRWMEAPGFRSAYRRARRELVEAAIGRVQAATGTAVNALVAVASQGRRDGDRVRAAVVLLDHSFRGLEYADLLHREEEFEEDAKPMGTADVVQLLATQMQRLERSELATSEKSRLSATLADALLRAIGVDVLDKRLEALQSVLTARQENEK